MTDLKRITGTKIHVAVDGNGLPISFVVGSANEHDSIKFVNVMESISDFIDSDAMEEIVSVMQTRVMTVKGNSRLSGKQKYCSTYSV